MLASLKLKRTSIFIGQKTEENQQWELLENLREKAWVLEKAPVGNNNIALLFIQNNSNFNNKVKHAYLGQP